MDRTKYIGMDVHQASISIAVRDASGKLVMESLIETKAATILEFLQGLKGTLWVTFEEGTSARLAIRSAQAARGQSDRMRPAQERVAENGQQERSRRCTEAEPSAARGTTHAGVPRRVGGAHLAGTGP